MKDGGELRASAEAAGIPHLNEKAEIFFRAKDKALQDGAEIHLLWYFCSRLRIKNGYD